MGSMSAVNGPTRKMSRSRAPTATTPRWSRSSRCSAGARRDAVRVEDTVDVAQAADGRLQRLGVDDLDHEAVGDHRRVDQAAGLDDVDAGLRERTRQVLEQAMAVPRVDLEL